MQWVIIVVENCLDKEIFSEISSRGENFDFKFSANIFNFPLKEVDYFEYLAKKKFTNTVYTVCLKNSAKKKEWFGSYYWESSIIWG